MTGVFLNPSGLDKRSSNLWTETENLCANGLEYISSIAILLPQHLFGRAGLTDLAKSTGLSDNTAPRWPRPDGALYPLNCD